MSRGKTRPRSGMRPEGSIGTNGVPAVEWRPASHAASPAVLPAGPLAWQMLRSCIGPQHLAEHAHVGHLPPLHIPDPVSENTENWACWSPGLADAAGLLDHSPWLSRLVLDTCRPCTLLTCRVMKLIWCYSRPEDPHAQQQGLCLYPHPGCTSPQGHG